MKPYFQNEEAGITLYHGDCREILPTLPKFDLLLTDPPYGVALDTDSSRFSGGVNGHISRHGNNIGTGKGAPIVGDGSPFDPSFLVGVARHHVIWGWNNYPDKLPRGACLVWLKRFDDAFGSFLSDAELAWMSKGSGVYCRRDMTNNATTRERAHPTQKPVSLMEWCLSFFPNAQTIADFFNGSGTTGVACIRLGRQYTGIEIEERYCEISAKRFEREIAQGKLFDAETLRAAESQTAILFG